MSRRQKLPPARRSAAPRRSRRRPALWIAVSAAILVLALLGRSQLARSRRGAFGRGTGRGPVAPAAVYHPRPPGTLAFSNPVASLLHRRCAPCHRAGEAGPFELITYADAASHAKSIARVTRDHLMPPW